MDVENARDLLLQWSGEIREQLNEPPVPFAEREELALERYITELEKRLFYLRHALKRTSNLPPSRQRTTTPPSRANPR